MTSYAIIDIEGIGEVYAKKLKDAGIKTTKALLDATATKKQRADLAEKTGISGALILTWANHADMMRVRGIGPQYAELLEASGVDTVKELAHRVPANLAAKMKEVNEKKNLTNGQISEKSIAKWVAEAKTLEPVMKY